MARAIMVQGTMSNAGKSLVVAGLCRIFRQDGLRACPFKSQNMALNSFITEEGLEMGRAQVMQAQAAGIAPSVRMNPILIKPNSDTGSQVIVNGEVRGNMTAAEYYKRKRELVPEILKAYRGLESEYDVMVIEGAGSPAEINLKENDIVNMGMAKMADAPVLLVGDIDRGGVFAQLYGTVKLLEIEEQQRIKGLVINKFRGDAGILRPGLEQLEKLTGIPVIGTLPYMRLDIDDEDSLSQRLCGGCGAAGERPVKIAVVRLPRLSNFTDFSVFDRFAQASLFYTASPEALESADLIILPGSKSTMADLLWLRQNGIEPAIQKAARRGVPVFGICGGYQMLGQELRDPKGVEGGGVMRGMGLLPVITVFDEKKHRSQVRGAFLEIKGALKKLTGMSFSGYEIHHGSTVHADCADGAAPVAQLAAGVYDGAQSENVYGTYVHGIFDEGGAAAAIVEALLEKKGLRMEAGAAYDADEYRQHQYDLLAEGIRSSMDMDMLYRIIGLRKGGRRA
ncbi:MAG: cobyric acid synthase [Lachnospiraceae bacterium]|nr:cobyric acid synthase [Lachnospiraceae bacterium]